jgi:hypothetical protein
LGPEEPAAVTKNPYIVDPETGKIAPILIAKQVGVKLAIS